MAVKVEACSQCCRLAERRRSAASCRASSGALGGAGARRRFVSCRVIQEKMEEAKT